MSSFSDTAIIIRLTEVGDHDLMVTLLTRDHGKLSAMAKNARQSVRRFGGALSLFARVDALIRPGRGQGIYFLMETELVVPNDAIQTRYLQTAYASLFCEVVNAFIEPESPQPLIFTTLDAALLQLDQLEERPELISIMFLMTFLSASGIMPDLVQCGACGKTGESLKPGRVVVDLAQGTLMCDACRTKGSRRVVGISMGTVKQLLWLKQNDVAMAGRLRLSSQATREMVNLLETYVPFHLGKELKSLAVLKAIRPSLP